MNNNETNGASRQFELKKNVVAIVNLLNKRFFAPRCFMLWFYHVSARKMYGNRSNIIHSTHFEWRKPQQRHLSAAFCCGSVIYTKHLQPFNFSLEKVKLFDSMWTIWMIIILTINAVQANNFINFSYTWHQFYCYCWLNCTLNSHC